jgi:putative ABC transport system permease protein
VVGMLERMLWRDLWHLRGQIFAAALVVACGVAALVGTRVVVDVSVDIPGLAEPAVARVVSIPERATPMLNDLVVLRGRWVDPGAANQVLVSQAFAKANQLQVGDRIGALLHGRWTQLAIVGIALSPECVYEVGRGMIFPDNKRFGVLWMAREALAPAFDMEGAFNDVALRLAPGANEREVLSALDTLLRPYGGLAAHGRDEQLSHRFLTAELGEIAILTTTVPSVFLAVGAFLL